MHIQPDNSTSHCSFYGRRPLGQLRFSDGKIYWFRSKSQFIGPDWKVSGVRPPLQAHGSAVTNGATLALTEHTLVPLIEQPHTPTSLKYNTAWIDDPANCNNNGEKGRVLQIFDILYGGKIGEKTYKLSTWANVGFLRPQNRALRLVFFFSLKLWYPADPRDVGAVVQYSQKRKIGTHSM